MSVPALLLGLLLGSAAGGACVWLVMRERVRAVTQARRELANEFSALSSHALQANATGFLDLARTQLQGLQATATADLDQRRKAVEELVAPIRESLERVNAEVRTLEQARRQDYGALAEQLRALASTHERLRAETGNLVTALRAPAVRGRWGEMQLRNAVEAAGMLERCDFVEQASVTTDDRTLRPDLVVRLPRGGSVVVDAKTPLQALLDALHAEDEETKTEQLATFVRHVREHMARLSAKAYWEQFTPAPDFVFMFLPGESFYRAALEQDPSLIEAGLAQRVILASPTTLITLLRTVALGWREERVAESARAVSELGRELHDRLAVLTGHVADLGKHLGRAVQSYNQTVGSYERRVLVSARRFTELGVGSSRELASPAPIEHAVQPPQAVELRAAEPAATTLDADAA